MVVRQKTFTLEEAAYLRSLPAVKEVSASRITYANWFKVECVRRYLKGEPARRIFREAGLEPSLIGSKRIERCISRWKSDGSIMGEAAKEKTEDLDDEKSNIDAVGGLPKPRPCWKITTSPMRRSWLLGPVKTEERCSTCAT